MVKPGDTVIDVGANAGYYTIIASRLVGETGRVYAFEPDPNFAAIIRKNVALNGCKNVVVVEKALSDKPGKIQLFIAPQNLGDHRIYQPEGESRTAIDVEAVAFDDYWKSQGGRRVNVVKIDTQGAEGVIVKGMSQTLADNRDRLTVFIEFWPHALKEMGSDAGELLAQFSSLGLAFHDLGLHTRQALRKVEAAELLAEHPLDKPDSQTNLLIVQKGRTLPDR
jgi:FkbM family methyltransferase